MTNIATTSDNSIANPAAHNAMADTAVSGSIRKVAEKNAAADTTIAAPPALTPTQVTALNSAQKDEANVLGQGTAFQTSRAVAYFNRHKLVSSVGAAALAYHVNKVMAYKIDGIKKGDFQICAMGILGLNVLLETDADAKKEANNRINDLRRALEALDHFNDEIAALSDEEFVAWFTGKGSLSGVYNEFRRVTVVEEEATRDDSAIDKAIDDMIANNSAIEVPNPRASTGVTLYVARGEGSKMRLVPLDVSADFIAKLSDRVPDPMTNAPVDVTFFRELLMTASRIVPDAMSTIPVKALKPGEKATANTPMLPATQTILVDDGVFSIANARVNDTLVLEVVPDSEELVDDLRGRWFIDTKTRKNMFAKLEPTSSAAGYKAVAIAPVRTERWREKRVSFERKREDGQLLLKTRDRMGSLNTMQVRGFKPQASASLDETHRAAFVKDFLPIAVKGRDDHAVTITFDDAGLSFQLGAAKAVKVPGGDAIGPANVRVARADFVRAVNGLLALPLIDEMIWSVDPRGLLRIEAYTASATYRVHVQLLRNEDDPKAQVRERALLERVEREADEQAAA